MEQDKNQLLGIWEDYSYAISKFDEQSLYIASGALALSLSFIKDIVPFNTSVFIWLFYNAILLFLIAIIAGFSSHRLSSGLSFKMYTLLLQKSEEKDEKERDEILSKIEETQNEASNKINQVNNITFWSLILGLCFLVVYCLINIMHVRFQYHCNC